jgi:purine-binding chemotaxis protein CheW
VGSFLFGIFENDISTTVQWRQPAPLPHAPPAVLGVVSIQGRMLTVLDSPPLLGGAADRDHSSRGFIVALRGDEQIALAIEDKAEALEVAMREIKPPSESAGRAIIGCLRRGDQLVNVLDVKALFTLAVKGRERRRRRF